MAQPGKVKERHEGVETRMNLTLISAIALLVAWIVIVFVAHVGSGPVHLLDEISKQLPDFLWLDSMNESGATVVIQGKATTYNAVSNFYNNLTGSRYFNNVVLGTITAIPVGVTFSVTCQFVPHPEAQAEANAASPPSGG